MEDIQKVNLLFGSCYACFGLAVIFLIATLVIYFKYNIRALRKELSGSMAQRRIEEIRQQSSNAAIQRGKVNVFEELEKKAKVKKSYTYSLNLSTTTSGIANSSDQGTSVLQSSSKAVNPDFIIEKDIMFVCTNEVI